MIESLGQEFWDARYRSRGELWSGEPNPRLVEQAAALDPGRALDVGCGEGADAVWLAARGWQVTALDVSTVALERGARRATETGADVALRIDWRHEDLLTWDGPDPDSYDLVSSQFMHMPPDLRTLLFARLAASVVAGGTLLIVGHDPSDHEIECLRRPMPERFFAAAEVAGSLDRARWDVLVAEAASRSATGHGGDPILVHDAVLRARRRPAPR